MIAASALELRRAVKLALAASVPLLVRLSGDKVFDEAPANSTPPYIAFADARGRDWSTSTDEGFEHILAIDIWTLHRGVQEALEIAELASLALTAAVLPMTGYQLISLVAQSVETRRENGGRYARARITFRARVESA